MNQVGSGSTNERLKLNLPPFRFEPEAFQLGVDRIMGRQSAGHAFLRAAVMASKGATLAGFGPSARSGKGFTSIVRKLSADVKPVWLSSSDVTAFTRIGAMHLADPSLGHQARLRLAVGSGAYSITGITHTISSSSVMTILADLPVAPIMPWDGLICTSRAVKSAVETVFASQEEYLRWKFKSEAAIQRPELPVIPLGVHCADFSLSESARRTARQELGIADDEVAFLFLGRLSFHAKAHPYPMYRALEAAAARTGKKILLIQCGWFGSDFIEQAFREGARNHCPSVRCLWLDGRNETDRAHAWASCDVFISLSDNIQETFGLTLIEAMAASKPVIATDWDGYRDLVVGGETGVLVKTFMPGAETGRDMALAYASGELDYDRYIGVSSQLVSVDFGALCDACALLAQDRERRKAMGQAGRRLAEARFDWAHVIDQYQAFWTMLQDIRRTELSAQRPQVRGAAADQLNPFTLFAGYPSHRITGACILLLGETATPYSNLKSDPFFTLSQVLIASDLPERILAALQAARSLTVLELLNSLQVAAPQAVPIIALLAKMGLVTITLPGERGAGS